MKLNRKYRSKSVKLKKAKKDWNDSLIDRKIDTFDKLMETFSKNKFGYVIKHNPRQPRSKSI